MILCSRGFAMVILQQATEALTALDLTMIPADFIAGLDDCVFKALVIPFLVIVFQVSMGSPTQ